MSRKSNKSKSEQSNDSNNVATIPSVDAVDVSSENRIPEGWDSVDNSVPVEENGSSHNVPTDEMLATLATDMSQETPVVNEPAVTPVAPVVENAPSTEGHAGPTFNVSLTNTDLTALRKSDRVAFHHKEGKGLIRCIKENHKRGPFQPKEMEYEITVSSNTVVFNGTDSPSEHNGSSCVCFELVHGYQEEWKTAASCLKLGDELRLKWTGSGNQLTRNAGLHMDSLRLEVIRPDARGETRLLTFILAFNCCADNTARMVKPNG